MRAIAVTSIAAQTAPGITKLFHLADTCSSELVIIGDKKSPDWDKTALPSFVHYFSVEDQIDKWPNLAKLLPFNHYARKNLAYLWAIENNVSILLDTDDDNSSEINVFENIPNSYRSIDSEVEWVNAYGYFGKNEIWPRGLPLDEARKPLSECVEPPAGLDWHCFQSIVDGDPDLDAVGRMLYPENHYFDNQAPLILTGRNFCPTNSQATLWKKELLPLLYLPVTSSFRMTDIWRGVIISGYMKATDMNSVFGKLGFIQDRNVHNLVSDFIDEVPGHVNNRKLKSISDEIWVKTISANKDFKSALESVYAKLVIENLLQDLDLKCLQEFLNIAESLSD